MQTTDDQEELFVVVDTDDNIVDYRRRAECHRDKSLIHRAVNLFIFDDTGRVLLQQRSLTKDTDPGVWSMSVGGHIAKGESYEQAMMREMQEELGITIPVKEIKKFVLEYPKEVEMEMFYTGISNGPFYPHPVEVAQVKFFEKKELQRLMESKEIQVTILAKHCLEVLDVIARE